MAGPSDHRSSATPLALAYAALVLYAALYPFGGWRWPPGQSLADLALLPWPPWIDALDLWLNGIGYLPLGLLATIAARRSGAGPVATLALGVLAPSLLSYLCELLQQFAPSRHPSLKDWSMNSAGAAVGWLIALGFQRLGLAQRWHRVRQRWFARQSAGALALLALWPVGLLVPVPVPLGLGQVDELLRAQFVEMLAGVPWADTLHDELVAIAARPRGLGPIGEAGITALGLLAPCLVAYSVTLSAWRRVVMAFGALALATATMTLATLLNFGPAHALAWIGGLTLPALAAGLLLALVLAVAPRPLVLGMALIVLTGLVLALTQAPMSPYFAQTLQAWEQGRFVHFHGLARWVGWLWPYVALVWLLRQLSRLSAHR